MLQQWIKDKKVTSKILISELAEQHEIFAAQELNKYFNKMTGQEIPIQKGGIKNETEPAIILLNLKRPANLDHHPELPVHQIKDDGFLIQSIGNKLYIAAVKEFGLVFGVYQYLQTIYRIQFSGYEPEGEMVPNKNTLEHGALSIVQNPELNYRGLQSVNDIKRIDWMAKNGFNTARYYLSLDYWDQKSQPLVHELKKRGIQIAFGHHIFHRVLPFDKYSKEFPEFFHQENGQTKAVQQFHWKLGNIKVIDEIVYVLEKFIERHPEIDILDFWPADGDSDISEEDYEIWTQKKFDRQNESWKNNVCGSRPNARLGNPYKAEVYASLVTKVATTLARRFPNLKISSCHYVDLVQPSLNVLLPKNVIPFIVMFWRCSKHSLFDSNCEINKQYAKVIQEWTNMYQDRPIYLYEYYMGMDCHASLPFPCLTTMFQEWKELRKIGIQGACIQSYDNHNIPYDINYTAFSKLAWDLEYPFQKHLDNYCLSMYGDSKYHIKKIYQTLENKVQEMKHFEPGIENYIHFLDIKTIDSFLTLIHQAFIENKSTRNLYNLMRLKCWMLYVKEALDVSHKIHLKKEKPNACIQSLTHLTKSIQEIKDMKLDIFYYPTNTKFVSMDDIWDKPSIWTRELALLQKESWIQDVFDPNILKNNNSVVDLD